MKKSLINIITLALVLVNLVLTIILTFSLVSTNKKTNKLVTKIGQIIDLDIAGDDADGNSKGEVSIEDIEYIDVMSGDSKNITVSYTDGGKTKYAVFTVFIGINKKSKDYSTKLTSINNGMKLIESQIINEALKYDYDTLNSNKTTMEEELLKTLQEQFQTEAICSVTIGNILVQ